MDKKKTGLFILGLLVLNFLTVNKLTKNAALGGRLSACKDIMTTINDNLPLGLECFIENNEVLMKSKATPGYKFKLDGELVNN